MNSEKNTHTKSATLDHKALGFKSGLEIHQRLATRHKLFCACPPDAAEDVQPSGVLVRRLRAVAGELGKVDPAAAFEAARGRTFHYQLIPEASCLLEQDEKPPGPLNAEALETALIVAKMLNAHVLDEVHVMRKTVADGSATSAFQRTALVAVNGHLDTPSGRVGIPTICVEEESSFIVSREENQVTYRLDRLGVPLIEIATDASIQDGAHAKLTAELIGKLLRDTGRVQRGIGTIRQDLNVSIRGGTRVEIKGAQALEDIEALVDNEARRQATLVEIKGELVRRGFKGVAFGKPHGVTDVFRKAKSFLSQPITEGKAQAWALKLLFTRDLLGKELMPNHRYGSELSDYAKSKTGIKGIIHCDEDPTKYGLAPEDFRYVAKELDCIADDGWVVVVADETTAIRALRAVFERYAHLDVIPETRRAEGPISKFMRPLPGAARMYPETDVFPVVIEPARLQSLQLPKTADERKAEYVAAGLNAEMADKLVRSTEWELFESLRVGGAEAKTIAWLLLDVKPTVRRQGVDERTLNLRLPDVLSLFHAGSATRAALQDLLALCAKEPDVPAEKLLHAANLTRITGSGLETLAKENHGDFGAIMKRFRLQVDAGELKALLENKKK